MNEEQCVKSHELMDPMARAAAMEAEQDQRLAESLEHYYANASRAERRALKSTVKRLTRQQERKKRREQI
jgi:hypothetical protein